MILVIGAKGGVGTTTVAAALVRALRGIGLDAADGQLAARLERPALLLSEAAMERRTQDLVDRIVRKRLSLVWTPECAFLSDPVLQLLRAVDERVDMIADGGIEPPPELNALCGQIIIVSDSENPVARYHEQRLVQKFPGARVIHGAGKEQIESLLTAIAR